jgi:hypothetical protein
MALYPLSTFEMRHTGALELQRAWNEVTRTRRMRDVQARPLTEAATGEEGLD